MYVHIYTYIYIASLSFFGSAAAYAGYTGLYHRRGYWPIQDILLLNFVRERIYHPCINPAHLHYPHYCSTIARLLRHI